MRSLGYRALILWCWLCLAAWSVIVCADLLESGRDTPLGWVSALCIAVLAGVAGLVAAAEVFDHAYPPIELTTDERGMNCEFLDGEVYTVHWWLDTDWGRQCSLASDVLSPLAVLAFMTAASMDEPAVLDCLCALLGAAAVSSSRLVRSIVAVHAGRLGMDGLCLVLGFAHGAVTADDSN